MRRVTFQSIPILLVFLALALLGSNVFDVMEGQKLLGQAETLLEKGEEDAAELVLADLLAQYPASQAATKGLKQLQYIKVVREKRERIEFSKILDSYKQVLNGYRSMYSEYPRSISALDESGYFFDFAYLDEITPEGYQIYLFLQADGSGYRI